MVSAASPYLERPAAAFEHLRHSSAPFPRVKSCPVAPAFQSSIRLRGHFTRELDRTTEIQTALDF